MFDEEDFVEFKTEAGELLESAENALLALDEGGDFKKSFDNIFRCFHNLKGSAGMMELTDLEHLTHTLETEFINFQDKTDMPKDSIDFFFKGIDSCRKLLNGEKVQEQAPQQVTIKQQNTSDHHAPNEEEGLVTNLDLSGFLSESHEALQGVSEVFSYIQDNGVDEVIMNPLMLSFEHLAESAHHVGLNSTEEIFGMIRFCLDKMIKGEIEIKTEVIDILYQSLRVLESMLKHVAKQKTDKKYEKIATQLVRFFYNMVEHKMPEALSEVQPDPVEKFEEKSNEKKSESATDQTQKGSNTIRVPVGLLDNLMNLVGEMVLVRNQVLQYSSRSDDSELLNMSKRLNVITSEIQEEMMKTRMQPIGNVLSKFNRVVRDLSKELQKDIKIHIHGSETELDKTLIEAIKDPLTHIVRNACDHGIEVPQERVGAGKNREGSITISAFHEGGQVVIDIADDGRGLDKEKLVKKAIEKNIITQSASASLSDSEIYGLIFCPGFSTAAQVTNISGRGVGMDVVKTNIEAIGGAIDVSSTLGKGMRIKIKLPLTLAIVPALIVKNGPKNIFAIPQDKLEELVLVDNNGSGERIEHLHGSAVFRLRGKVLPLINVSEMLNTDKGDVEDSNHTNIAVLNADGHRFGIMIDEILDTADIVVKPLNKLLRALEVYSGATILGDGAIALIFDVLGLSRRCKISENVQDDDTSLGVIRRDDEIQDFLLFEMNSPAVHAIPLSYVNRLEEFSISAIERSGPNKVIRYGSNVLPLIDVNKVLQLEGEEVSINLTEKINVIVLEKTGNLYGLVVNRVLDTLGTPKIVDTSLEQSSYYFGNLNLDNQLIVVINPFEVIEGHLHGERPKAQTRMPGPINGSGSKILLVDDGVFFRKSIKKVLERCGHEVLLADDGEQALKILNNTSNDINVVVSDIEMPNLNGFQMAQMIRANPYYSELPMIAVSSKADATYRKKGKDAGFDMYLEKLNPAVLVEAIEELNMKKRKVS